MKKPWTLTAFILGLCFTVSALFRFAYLSYLPKCPFYQTTGLHCPGCGGTRAVKAIARGDFFLALHSNALFFSFSCVAIFLLGKFIFQEWKYGHVTLREFPKITTWLIIGVTLSFTILRNIPNFPLLWLEH